MAYKLLYFISFLVASISVFAQDRTIDIDLNIKKNNNYYISGGVGFYGSGGGRRLCDKWNRVFINEQEKNFSTGNNFYNSLKYFYNEKPLTIRYQGYIQRLNWNRLRCSGDDEDFNVPINVVFYILYSAKG